MKSFGKAGFSLCSVLAATIACTGPVQAQEAVPEDADGAAEGETAPGDIVVTAQRRSERLRDVPLSITAVSGENLERAGITNIAELPAIVPGLLIVRSGAFTQPAIRGVTSTASDPGNDSNVAIYLDGVYQPNQGANSFDLPDVERVEVLKGPQGTLFGRNATGGAIRVVTREPGRDLEGLFSAGYGSFNEFTLRAYVSGPLAGDTVSASLTGYYQTHDGYYRDVATGERRGGLDSRLLRARILVRPSDSSSILLSGHYVRRLDNGATAGGTLNGNALARVLAPTALIADEPYEIASDFDTSVFVEAYSASVRGEFETGIGTITALSAYTDTHVQTRVDGDYSSADLINFLQTQPNTTWMNELTLASRQFGIFSFTAGAFHYQDRARRYPQDTLLPTSTVRLLARQNTDAYAVFGEGNFRITPDLLVLFGLRYTSEQRTLFGSRAAYALGTEPPLPTSVPRLAGETFESLTPRASIRYSLAPRTNIYATYSRGFKSGGFTTTVLSPVPYDPEINDLFEIGIKSDDIAGLHFELAAFYNRYADQQVVAIVNNVGIIQNAASSSIYGAEMSLSWRLSEQFHLDGSVAWLHARYGTFPNAIVSTPSGNGGNVDVTINAAGNHMLRAPDLTATLGATYRSDLPIGELELGASLVYSSRVFYDVLNRVSQAPHATIGLRAALQPAGTNLRLSAWARNLTDQAVIQSTFIYSYADGVSYAPPRSFGVALDYRF